MFGTDEDPYAEDGDGMGIEGDEDGKYMKSRTTLMLKMSSQMRDTVIKRETMRKINTLQF